VIAFSRSVGVTEDLPSNTVLVLVNTSPKSETATLELGDLAGDYVDWFVILDEPNPITLSNLQTIELEPNSYRVLTKLEN
jgi:hypothetical protein